MLGLKAEQTITLRYLSSLSVANPWIFFTDSQTIHRTLTKLQKLPRYSGTAMDGPP